MHETTLASFDPSSRQAADDDGAQLDLVARWKALPKAAQELYRRVRDSYVEQQDGDRGLGREPRHRFHAGGSQ